MFAAAANRVEAVKLLLRHGADPDAATKIVDLAGLSRDGANPDGRNLAANPNGRSGGNDREPAAAPGATTATVATLGTTKTRLPGIDRQFLLNELVYAQGGMTPLLFAARQGHAQGATVLNDAGVDVNTPKAGD